MLKKKKQEKKHLFSSIHLFCNVYNICYKWSKTNFIVLDASFEQN